MDNSYKHIRIVRETPVNVKRSGGYPRIEPPENPKEYGQSLLDQFHHASQTAKQEDIAGFDDRLLLKISTDSGFNPKDGFSFSERFTMLKLELYEQMRQEVCLNELIQKNLITSEMKV